MNGGHYVTVFNVAQNMPVFRPPPIIVPHIISASNPNVALIPSSPPVTPTKLGHLFAQTTIITPDKSLAGNKRLFGGSPDTHRIDIFVLNISRNSHF